MRLKGRHWVAVWLVAFLAVTWLVYARQPTAIHDARELIEIRARRANLEGHKAELERRVRAEQSRAVLVPRAQAKLGLHLPADSEIILIPLPGRGAGLPSDGEAGGAPRVRGARRVRRSGAARGARGAGAAVRGSSLGGGGAGAAHRADRAAGAPRHAERPARHAARAYAGDLPRRRRAQRAARCGA